MTQAQRAIEALRKPDASLARVPNTVRQSIADIIEAQEKALKAADLAINPPDRGGISLDKWNERLKAATAEIRAALTSTEREP